MSLFKDILRLLAFALGSTIAWIVVYWTAFVQEDRWVLAIGFNRFGEGVAEGIVLHAGAGLGIWALADWTKRPGKGK